jgi:hypothetical protein
MTGTGPGKKKQGLVPSSISESILIRDKDNEGVGYQKYHSKTQGLTSWYMVSGWNKGLIRNLRDNYLQSTEAGLITSYGPASDWEDAIWRTREPMFDHPRSGAMLY